MELKGSVIVITGASRGLGRALAEALTANGARLVLCGRDAGELNAVAASLHALAVPCDVTDAPQVQAVADAAVTQHGRIDCWINNAGIWTPHSDITELDIGRVHAMLEVNLFGTMHGSRVALMQMRKHGSGVIVNVLSTSALEGRANSAGYAASKLAAVGYTKSLRHAGAPDGIRVIGLYPGGMQTSIWGDHRPDNFDTYLKPADVARRAVDELAKDEPVDDLTITKDTLAH